MISGINSSYSSIYQYQSSINQLRLSQAIAKNPEYESLFNKVGAWNDKLSESYNSKNNAKKSSSLGFLQDYNKTMGSVMQSANTLRAGNSSGLMGKLIPNSSDDSVATVTKNFNLRQEKSYTLNVTQLAMRQENRSTAVIGKDTARGDMNFSISNNKGTFHFSIDAIGKNGENKTNLAMLQEAADAINSTKAGVTAVVEEDQEGRSLLSIYSDETGTESAFEVSGQMGAAEGAQAVSQTAANAKYSITEGGATTDFVSQSNQVSLDYGRMQADLKGTGTTDISAVSDNDEIVAAAAELVNNYNKAASFLEGNTSRGRGVAAQADHFSRSIASNEAMKRLGISADENGRLSLNQETLRSSLEKEPELTRELLSGSHGLAETLFNRSSSAMNANSASLLSADLKEINNSIATEPFQYMSFYSGRGSFNMNNYAAVGIMMDFFA